LKLRDFCAFSMATSLLRVGGDEIAQGDRAGGLKYYREVLAIEDSLPPDFSMRQA
jgi:hypothetical protein